MILVSHDRHLIDACADRLWLVADGNVTPYEGDLDDYRNFGKVHMAERRRLESKGPDQTVQGRPQAAAQAAS